MMLEAGLARLSTIGILTVAGERDQARGTTFAARCVQLTSDLVAVQDRRKRDVRSHDVSVTRRGLHSREGEFAPLSSCYRWPPRCSTLRRIGFSRFPYASTTRSTSVWRRCVPDP